MADVIDICGSCGTPVAASARFCVNCGAAIGVAEATVEAGAIHTISGVETGLPVEAATQAQLASLPTLEKGAVIAEKYRIESLIGKGGMGAVYKVVELVSGQIAALKIIAEKYAGNQKAIQQFINEGMVTRGISHPNIVQVYDIGSFEGQPYLAMEYIDAQPLHIWRNAKLQAGKEVPVNVAAKIISEILDGLEAAHRLGIVHRDLKPENILLTGEPSAKHAKIKIVDFGIALARSGGAAATTQTTLGTQLYMAPEQVRSANAANASADLYSVSKIFYELIVGVLPTGHWQPPSAGRSDIPPGVDRLIERGLSTNRDMRPQSTSEYRVELARAFERRTSAVPAAHWARKPKYLLATGAAGLAAILVASLAMSGGETTDSWQVPSNIIDGDDVPTPPPVVARYDYYNGVWADGFGGAYQISVQNNGSFSGNGALNDGSPVQIMGQMSRSRIEYQISYGGQIVAEGQGRKTDQCHFAFTTHNFLTNSAVSGSFHVNHQPGQPCP